jgi:hypothetical protein
MNVLQYAILDSRGSVDWSETTPFTVLVPSFVAAEPTFRDHVHLPVAAVIEDLRQLVHARDHHATSTDAVAIMITSASGRTTDERAALHEALFEALRGVVGSLTLELAPSGLLLNLVRANDIDQARATLDFLATDKASFVAGSTIDLTEENQP